MRLGVIAILLAACGDDEPPPEVPPPAPPTAYLPATPASATRSAPLNPRLLRRFRPLRQELTAADRPRTAALVDLGRMLYFDDRLSNHHDLSCNSCHPLADYGADGRALSLGDRGQPGKRNAPSTFNAAGMFAQFWDGRSADVETQALAPLTNPTEMAMSPDRVVHVLHSIPEYRAAFAAAFPDAPISFANVGVALGAFERGLTTPARWDRYVAGDRTAITAAEVEGLRVFTNVGCITCHTGELLGGTSFQQLGVIEPWPNAADRGRFEVTKVPADDMVFRVPSLRNVEMTAPYFHDGSAATLPVAIAMMGHHQLGIELTAREVASIAAWLHTLTGDLPTPYIRPPALPPSPLATTRNGT